MEKIAVRFLHLGYEFIGKNLKSLAALQYYGTVHSAQQKYRLDGQ